MDREEPLDLAHRLSKRRVGDRFVVVLERPDRATHQITNVFLRLHTRHSSGALHVPGDGEARRSRGIIT